MKRQDRRTVWIGGEPAGQLADHRAPRAGRDATIHLRDGGTVTVPGELLRPRAEGGYEAAAELTRALEAPTPEGDGRGPVIALAEERLRVRRRRRTRGRVVVRVRTVERDETVDLPLEEERVEIERVRVDRLVDRPEGVRREGDVTIVPVMEEVLVVEKRLRVREEIRIRRIRTQRRVRRTVTLRREEADVRRVPGPDGG